MPVLTSCPWRICRSPPFLSCRMSWLVRLTRFVVVVVVVVLGITCIVEGVSSRVAVCRVVACRRVGLCLVVRVSMINAQQSIMNDKTSVNNQQKVRFSTVQSYRQYSTRVSHSQIHFDYTVRPIRGSLFLCLAETLLFVFVFGFGSSRMQEKESKGRSCDATGKDRDMTEDLQT